MDLSKLGLLGPGEESNNQARAQLEPTRLPKAEASRMLQTEEIEMLAACPHPRPESVGHQREGVGPILVLGDGQMVVVLAVLAQLHLPLGPRIAITAAGRWPIIGPSPPSDLPSSG